MTEKTLAERIGAAPAPTLPHHPEVAVWRAATRDDIDDIHSILVATDAVDHPTWITPREEIADSFDLSHIDHSRDTIIAYDAEGRSVAFCSAFLHPSRDGTLTVHIDGAVRPELRRRGVGAQAFAWGHARALQQLAEAVPTLEPGEWDLEIKVYAEETTPDVITMTAPYGLTVERWFTSMVRDMASPVPTPPTPDGVTVVPYSADRALDVLAARNDAFRDHWGIASDLAGGLGEVRRRAVPPSRPVAARARRRRRRDRACASRA